jgi:hypothetical protein
MEQEDQEGPKLMEKWQEIWTEAVQSVMLLVRGIRYLSKLPELYT